jgi:hypothetical protein
MANWFGGNGEQYTEDEVLQELKEYGPTRIYVGCDSQLVKDRLIFALAICVIDDGARYWIRRTSTDPNNYTSLKIRLITEVTEACLYAEKLSNAFNLPITVHADINTSPKYPSSAVVKQVVNYITALGFDHAVKPDSWASCTVADKHSK